MDSRILAILVIVVVVLGIAVWMYLQRRRTQKLRSRFGPEYDRAVEETGGRRSAETLLERREKRVEHLHIRPLTRNDQERFAEAWRADQARFVDDPKAAVIEADRLVGEVMQARGYPVADFEQRAADISVEYPHVVENYRAAHEIAVRAKRGEASTEDLRQALVYYRKLFEELVGVAESTLREVKR